jgi:hypothetical protein
MPYCQGFARTCYGSTTVVLGKRYGSATEEPEGLWDGVSSLGVKPREPEAGLPWGWVGGWAYAAGTMAEKRRGTSV